MVANKKIKGSQQPSATKNKGFMNFFKDLKSEFKRITWASKEDVKKATITVLVFCFVYVLIIGMFDYGFNNLFKLIFNLK
ncbi:preprotein translocase subunit SecE [Clostridium oceanicum]|uniref:Protein translocase subunit SecE n=1 Tax=Clostridium oceanicum TaxID=1543 RepID=A0ABN1JSS1_9CLOT